MAGLQELEILVHVFSCTYNMFAYAIVHLRFRASQIVVRARMYAYIRMYVYLAMYLLQR